MPARRQTQARDAIQRTTLIKAPPERVFAAFEDESLLEQWYYSEVSVALHPGGFLVFQGIEGEVRATVEEVEAPSLVVLDYHPPWWGRVTWKLSPTKTGTRVTLLHEGFEGREEWTQRFAWGWESNLKNLKAVLEGRAIK